MTVKELIEQLQKFNPETEVRVEVTDPTNWTYQNPIEYDLSLGVKGYEEYNDDDFELDEDDYPDYDRVKESSKVVIINGGGC